MRWMFHWGRLSMPGIINGIEDVTQSIVLNYKLNPERCLHLPDVFMNCDGDDIDLTVLLNGNRIKTHHGEVEIDWSSCFVAGWILCEQLLDKFVDDIGRRWQTLRSDRLADICADELAYLNVLNKVFSDAFASDRALHVYLNMLPRWVGGKYCSDPLNKQICEAERLVTGVVKKERGRRLTPEMMGFIERYTPLVVAVSDDVKKCLGSEKKGTDEKCLIEQVLTKAFVESDIKFKEIEKIVNHILELLEMVDNGKANNDARLEAKIMNGLLLDAFDRKCEQNYLIELISNFKKLRLKHPRDRPPQSCATTTRPTSSVLSIHHETNLLGPEQSPRE